MTKTDETEPSEQVKITAFISRDLWGQTKLLATQRGTSAKNIVAEALRAFIHQANKERGGGRR